MILYTYELDETCTSMQMSISCAAFYRGGKLARALLAPTLSNSVVQISTIKLYPNKKVCTFQSKRFFHFLRLKDEAYKNQRSIDVTTQSRRTLFINTETTPNPQV